MIQCYYLLLRNYHIIILYSFLLLNAYNIIYWFIHLLIRSFIHIYINLSACQSAHLLISYLFNFIYIFFLHSTLLKLFSQSLIYDLSVSDWCMYLLYYRCHIDHPVLPAARTMYCFPRTRKKCHLLTTTQ